MSSDIRVNSYVRHLCEQSEAGADGILERLYDNLIELPLEGRPNRFLGGRDRFGGDYKRTPAFTSFKEFVVEECNDRLARGLPPLRLIILDPASRFMGLDSETDNAAATCFIEAIEQLKKELSIIAPPGPVILLAHHTMAKSPEIGRASCRERV